MHVRQSRQLIHLPWIPIEEEKLIAQTLPVKVVYLLTLTSQEKKKIDDSNSFARGNQSTSAFNPQANMSMGRA
jgi:hypothetical protein